MLHERLVATCVTHLLVRRRIKSDDLLCGYLLHTECKARAYVYTFTMKMLSQNASLMKTYIQEHIQHSCRRCNTYIRACNVTAYDKTRTKINVITTKNTLAQSHIYVLAAKFAWNNNMSPNNKNARCGIVM